MGGTLPGNPPTGGYTVGSNGLDHGGTKPPRPPNQPPPKLPGTKPKACSLMALDGSVVPTVIDSLGIPHTAGGAPKPVLLTWYDVMTTPCDAKSACVGTPPITGSHERLVNVKNCAPPKNGNIVENAPN